MGLTVFYPSDIRNALLAAEQSASATAEAISSDDAFIGDYLEGYHAALTTIALAFGLIDRDAPQPPMRRIFTDEKSIADWCW